MIQDVLDRHRGPYTFQLYRPASKPGFHTSEWVPGVVSKDDVIELATMHLTDPRDTVEDIGVWSQTEGQFVTVIRRKDIQS